jgi:hypothetical protein
MKSLLVGAMALAFNSSQAIQTTPAFTHNPYIEKISCDLGTGTGFKLDSGLWVSVNHVTRLGNCSVDGIPIIITYADPLRDFSTFIVPGDIRAGGLKVDCSGFQASRWYYGTGHAKGLPILTSIAVLYIPALNIGPSPRGWRTLAYSRYIPGQSGGPAFNQHGGVTGTVNAYSPIYPLSFSLPMKETPLCPA